MSPLYVQAQTECFGQTQIENILKYHLWVLHFTKYNYNCSQITSGDFNNDGKKDFAAVLTELYPFDKYANGKKGTAPM